MTSWRDRFRSSDWPTKAQLDSALRLLAAAEEHRRSLTINSPVSARRQAMDAASAAARALGALWPHIPDTEVPYLPKGEVASYAAYTGLTGALANAMGRDGLSTEQAMDTDAYRALAGYCRAHGSDPFDTPHMEAAE